MQIIDNINHIVKNDLQDSIQPGSKLSIAAACFSIYAYQELKKQLEGIDELRFIFTSPTFVTEKTPKAQREFYIPRISRERSLYGTEFEVKLRNELTQKAVAKECTDWIRRKVVFKSNVTQEQMMGFMRLTATHRRKIWTSCPRRKFYRSGWSLNSTRNMRLVWVFCKNSPSYFASIAMHSNCFSALQSWSFPICSINSIL